MSVGCSKIESGVWVGLAAGTWPHQRGPLVLFTMSSTFELQQGQEAEAGSGSRHQRLLPILTLFKVTGRGKRGSSGAYAHLTASLSVGVGGRDCVS